MRRQLLAAALALCLLAGTAAAYHFHRSVPGEQSVTRMADLGLMLLDEESGVSVLAVRDRSPADRAGIRPGDVLLCANGTAFADVRQLEEMLPHTRSMRIQLRRDRDQLVTVQLSMQ